MSQCNQCGKTIKNKEITSRKAGMGGKVFCRAKCRTNYENANKAVANNNKANEEREERKKEGMAQLKFHASYKTHMTTGEIPNGGGKNAAHAGLHVITNACQGYKFEYLDKAKSKEYRQINCFAASVKMGDRNSKDSTFFPLCFGLDKIEQLLRACWGDIYASGNKVADSFISVDIPGQFLLSLKPAKGLEVWLVNKTVRSVYPILPNSNN